VISLAIAEELRESHPWLRASLLEGIGFGDTIIEMDALPPERKARAFACNGSQVHIKSAATGLPPYERAYTDIRLVGTVMEGTYGFGTYDQELTNPENLRGKKLASMSKFAGPYAIADALLRDAWGIVDDVDISYLKSDALNSALVTGIADFLFPMSISVARGGKFSPDPNTTEIMAARQTYIIGATQADVDKINAAHPWSVSLKELPKGILGENNPPETVNLVTFSTYMMGWETADPEVVYELTKFIAENEEALSSRARNMPLDIQSLARIAPGDEDLVHPGALRYFEEQGYKIK